MAGNNRMQIVLILLFCFAVIVFGQDKQVNEDKRLREEILTIYKSKGERGLRDFVKRKKDRISNKFIVDFAEAGKKARKEEWLKACKIMAEEKKDEKTLADVLYQTGIFFRLISDYKKATDYFDKTLPIYLKINDIDGQGNVYLKKGIIHSDTGYNTKAMKMYQKALPFFEKAKNPQGQGSVYFRKGAIYLGIGKNVKAFEMYDKALPFFEKAEEYTGQGNIYWSKGYIFLRTGENAKAIEMYEKALSLFEKAEEPIGQGNVYVGKGMIYSGTGKNSKAFEMYDKALFFFEKAGQPIGQGNVNLLKGHIYLRIGKYLKALKMYNVALPFFEKAKEPRGQGAVYENKGIFYLKIGENAKALEMLDKALPFFEKVGEPIGLGNVYMSKGNIYLRTGDNSKAIEMYDKALHFFEKIGEPVGQGNVYYRKGFIYFYSGKNLKALEMYNKALLFYEKTGQSISQGNVHLKKGEFYFRDGQNSKALEGYDKALHFFKKAGAISSETIALIGKAHVLAKLEKKEEALKLFEKGIAKLEKLRTQTVFSDMKISFMEKVYDQYEQTVLFFLENKFYKKGFKYTESMKSRVFLDRMAEGLVRIEKGIIPGLKERRDKLVTKLSSLSKSIHKTAGKKDEKRLTELKNQYRKVENEFEELLIEIKQDNPLYASVRYPQPITVQTLQKEILKKGETLLSYFISKEIAYAFIVSRENFKVKQLKVNEKEINGNVERYLHSIKENNANDMKRFGSHLYEKLFKPLEKHLKKSRDIILVPSGKLETIPFESLIVSKKKPGHLVFLLEKYRLKYVQSASLLSILRKYYTGESTSNGFIGFGDPIYDYDDFEKNKQVLENSTASLPVEEEIRELHRHRYARAGGKLLRLYNSGEEIKTIARFFEQKSQKCKIYLRDQASEEHAKSPDLKEFDYIHFSCHGLFNDDFQSLVLSQLPQDKSREDGYLTLNEIINCDYHAKLVVLSACQTGSGKMYRGEGVTGLTRAVMYAGTPAVIASLWKVDDTATKELMVKFYKNMLEKNLDKAEALRQAKLELLKYEKYSSPLFWSAFVLYGE